MFKFIYYIWNFNIRIFPVSILVFIYMLPNEFRKKIRFKYAPLYFSIPPFYNSKELGINFYGDMEEIIKGDISVKRELKKIKNATRFSAAMETVIWPIVYGIIMAGLINISKELLFQVLFIIILIRIIQFSKSTVAIIKEEIFTYKSIIFFNFILFSIKIIYNTYQIVPKITLDNIAILLEKGIDFILYNLIVPIAFSYLAPNVLFDFMSKGKWGRKVNEIDENDDSETH